MRPSSHARDHTHAHTHARARTRTRTHARTHAHAHAQAQDWGLLVAHTSPFRYLSPTAGWCPNITWPGSVRGAAYFSLLHTTTALLDAFTASNRIDQPVPLFYFDGAANAVFFPVGLFGSFALLFPFIF